MSKTLDDYLEHFGVKGMKWGVRRRGRSASGATDEVGQRKASSSDAKKTGALTDRAPDQLTTKQLQAVNKRLNLEREYARLNPTKGEVLKSQINNLLNTLEMGNRAYNLVNSPAGKQLMATGQKALKMKKVPATT